MTQSSMSTLRGSNEAGPPGCANMYVVRESSVGQIEDGYVPIGVAWKRIAATSVVQIGEAQLIAALVPGGNR